ncbi:MAG TPA: SPFH domain-containing protein [Acidobacteriaceae bacterium]|nr:SPFH domain-containing protein [Acidobacteriaceae bacterium]
MNANVVAFLEHYGWIIALLLVIVLYRAILRVFFGAVIIGKEEIGIVNKRWVLLGKHRTLPGGSIIALNGEAGLQAETLAPGVHFGLWIWQYTIYRAPFTTIDKGHVGIVEARDGHPLSNGRVLARAVDCNSFQDARGFLMNGGQRGPQISIIPPGAYRINTALFQVTTGDVLEVPDNMVGIVTTKDGRPLPSGEIAGKEVPGHNLFQDAESFITAGGFKGMQEQVILAGRYFINPRFATVETRPMTEVPIANVGVVIAYVGEEGKDLTGDTFKHGNLVSRGQKGVWFEPLDPGKYPINPFTHKVEVVPTANIVLNWATGKSEAHKLDEKLSTITVRSSDGFTFNLDVSQIIHVPRNDAPKVIARFGTMANLVTQVLEPTIGNYFRNAAQTSDVIEFLRHRSERQAEAKVAISAALTEYNVNAIDTLIGDITPPDALMKTLTDRKIAEQEQVTYKTQQLAEETRKDLQQARAMADTQAKVVDSERSVAIADFTAQASVKRAEGDARSRIIGAEADAKSKTINAQADANVVTMVGNAEAEKTKAVGTAEADVIKQKIDSMESGNYALVQVMQALAQHNVPLVPQIVAGGGGSGQSGSTLVDVLLANLLKDSVKSANGNGATTNGTFTDKK